MRAAYVAAPQSIGVRLTGEEHQRLPDDELRAEAMAESDRNNLGIDPEDIIVGEWQ